MALVPSRQREPGSLASRRSVLRGAVGGLAGLSVGPAAMLRPATAGAQLTAQAPVERLRLADDLYLLSVAGTNVVASTAPDGTTLVDGASAQHSVALLSAVAALPGSGAVHTLFNTHWHPEQTGSNEHLGRSGATIISHENTRLWLTVDVTWPWNGRRSERLAEVARPNDTFYDSGEIDINDGPPVRYGHLRHAAHTDGDIYVHFPDANVIAVGGAVRGQGWQLMDWWTGGWIGGVVGGLEFLLSMTDEQTRVVPAHGPLLRRSDLEAQYRIYDTICERIIRLLHTGHSPDEAVEARVTAEFDAAMGDSEEFIKRAFESTWAYMSPDA